jgi:hypothetical protein
MRPTPPTNPPRPARGERRGTSGASGIRGARGTGHSPRSGDHRLGPAPRPEFLESIRFGEFLRDRFLISDEQWLAALAEHWSVRGRKIGEIIADHGYLPATVIEQQALIYHELDVVEIAE